MKFTSFKFVLFLLSFLFVFSSCQTSRDVVTGKAFQKRKLNKGFYVNLGKKSNKVAEVKKEKEKEKTEDAVLAEVVAQPVETKSKKEESTALSNKEVPSKNIASSAKSNSDKNARKVEKKANKKTERLLEKSINFQENKTRSNTEVMASTYDPNGVSDVEVEGRVRQGLYLVLVGLLVGLIGSVLGIGFVSWAGGVIVFVGLIILILGLLDGL